MSQCTIHRWYIQWIYHFRWYILISTFRMDSQPNCTARYVTGQPAGVSSIWGPQRNGDPVPKSLAFWRSPGSPIHKRFGPHFSEMGTPLDSYSARFSIL